VLDCFKNFSSENTKVLRMFTQLKRTITQKQIVVNAYFCGMGFLGIAPSKIEFQHANSVRFDASLHQSLGDVRWDISPC